MKCPLFQNKKRPVIATGPDSYITKLILYHGKNLWVQRYGDHSVFAIPKIW